MIQERQETDLLDDEITHSESPDDRLLNLAQLHSSKLVQVLQPDEQYFPFPRAELIEQAMHNRHVLENSEPEPEVVPPLPIPQSQPEPIISSSSIALAATSSQPARPKRSRVQTTAQSSHSTQKRRRQDDDAPHPQHQGGVAFSIQDYRSGAASDQR